MKVRILYPSAFAAMGIDADKEVVEIDDAQVVRGLLEAGFAEEVKPKKPQVTRKKTEKAVVRLES